eukprot:GHVP01061871.1.p1 GENE.GHVP01061871.1~~GHVP01061871.1.p1  ORF type:complete len:511 (-),score=91.75 GHVP01061871.1:748-2280(-)
MKPLSFGTAGIRGIVGDKDYNINEAVVQKLAQALCLTIGLSGSSVFVGYDHRKTSFSFARIIAKTIQKYADESGINITVVLLSEPIPTPFMSFACKNSKKLIGLDASAGFIVTASHNPKEYNGVKVYTGRGTQIEEQTERKIEEIMHKIVSLWDLSDIVLNTSSTVSKISKLYTEELISKYGSYIQEEAPKIVYTPVHGVGQKYIDNIIKSGSLPHFIKVPSQCDPDPEFKTLRFPNPEDGEPAFKEAVLMAEKTGSNIIFASDPDVDRFALAENIDGKWKYFTGNEIAILLLESPLEHTKTEGSTFISSFTSSLIFSSIADAKGMIQIETDPGFKNIGTEAMRQSDAGNNIVLAFEDSFGYMPGDIVWEKDAIATAYHFYILACELYNSNRTFSSYLDSVLKKYPKVISYSFNYSAENTEVISSILKSIRDEIDGKDTFLIGDNSLSVVSKGINSFVLRDSTKRIILRPSGTEPKIKIYVDFLYEENKDFVDILCKKLFNYPYLRCSRK